MCIHHSPCPVARKRAARPLRTAGAALCLLPLASYAASGAGSAGYGPHDAAYSNGAGDSAEAVAPQTGTQLQEIVVTAEKRKEKLLDVPVPVTAIDARALVDSGQLRLQDYFSSVPGLSYSPAAGVATQEIIAIRGITTGFNTNPTVAIVIDDVPFGSSTNLLGNIVPEIDPDDLAQVEVLRGPQGTLYGGSGLGGVIKFVTREPTMDSLSGRVQAGADDVHNGAQTGYQFRGAVNVPLGDELAVRVSGFTRQDPGYLDMAQTDIQGVNKGKVYGGQLSALWRPLEAISLKMSALVQDIKLYGSPYATVGPGFGDLQQAPTAPDVRSDTKIQAYSATLSATVGKGKLTAVSGYSVNTVASAADLTPLFGPLAQLFYNVPFAVDFANAKTSRFTQELRFSVPVAARLDWLLGGYYTYENSPYQEAVPGVSASGATVGNLITVPVPTRYREYAAFTDFTVHFTDRFDLQLGGRESEIRQTAEAYAETGALLGGTLAVPAVHSSANAFTYLITPSYKVSPNLMAYARFASGYRPGGPEYNPDPSIPREYRPDTTHNYELGVKGETLEHRLSFDASIYYIGWKDIQLGLQAPNHLSYTGNGGTAKSEGVELSIESRPVQGLKLSGWVAWNEAVLREVPPASTELAAGDRLPYSSRVSGSVSADKEIPMATAMGFIGGTVSYVGQRYGDFAAGAPQEVFPGYARIDVRAGLQHGPWQAKLFANNITDRRGVLNGNPQVAGQIAYITPRTIGLSLAREF